VAEPEAGEPNEPVDEDICPVVKNTFIHLISSPTTRQRSRSLSLPRRTV
jgi:hypothetical protein